MQYELHDCPENSDIDSIQPIYRQARYNTPMEEMSILTPPPVFIEIWQYKSI